MKVFDDHDKAAAELIQRVGNNIVLATPLGIGKPNHLLNSLYKKAKEDPQIKLTILTALTLNKPQAKSDLEKRFLEPFVDRVFGNYPDLEYEKDRLQENLPNNIEIIEFYFKAGSYINKESIQKNYLSSNYTHVARDIFDRGVNVLCQQVSQAEVDGKMLYSLSCNSDLTIDLAIRLKDSGRKYISIAQVNQNLPFMYGESIVKADFIDLLVDNRALDFDIFSPPKMAVCPTDHMIGLHASTLLKDDGEIQIGIGSLGDALAYALCLRQKDNPLYKKYLEDLVIDEHSFPLIKKSGDLEIFNVGLFAATEMLVDSFSELYKEKILKKKVFDSVVLQRLINLKKIQEHFSDDILNVLVQERVIGSELSELDVTFLVEFGVFKKDIRWDKGELILIDDRRIKADVSDPKNLQIIKTEALGRQLRNGAIAHGGFFLGPKTFYNFLKELPVAERKLFRMKRISQINQLYGHEDLNRLQRTNARFINTCMKVSLNGAASSDALEDGNQISGVGGQYNFVSMAHELLDAHSILQLRSTRINSLGKLESNIVFQYGNCTIPRHLRDIVITEYGIAELKGKTDEEVAIELIQITDSRFQNGLIQKAQAAHKLSAGFQLKERFKNNYPNRFLPLFKEMSKKNHFLPFPFGTDFTEDEIKLMSALKKLKSIQKNKIKFIGFFIKSLFSGSTSLESALKRMNLSEPKTLKEKIYKKLLTQALLQTY